MIVTTTVGSADEATRLARALVEARLAACVQVEVLLHSTYRWQGQVREDAEWRLVVKTLPSRAADLQAFFAEQHPYEVPQFTAWHAVASEAYADWVKSETA